MDNGQVDITDGRMTAGPNEVCPDGRTFANSSMHDSWVVSKGYHSPFLNNSVKKRKRGTTQNHEDFKSKISSYRQQYYDQIYNANNIEGSITDGDKMNMTVTTRNSAIGSRAANRLKKAK